MGSLAARDSRLFGRESASETRSAAPGGGAKEESQRSYVAWLKGKMAGLVDLARRIEDAFSIGFGLPLLSLSSIRGILLSNSSRL